MIKNGNPQVKHNTFLRVVLKVRHLESKCEREKVELIVRNVLCVCVCVGFEGEKETAEITAVM